MDSTAWGTRLRQGLEAIKRNETGCAAAVSGSDRRRHELGLKCEEHVRETLQARLLERGLAPWQAELALLSELGLKLWDRLEGIYPQDGALKLLTRPEEADELWRELEPPPGSALARARTGAGQLTLLDGFDPQAYWLEKRPRGLYGILRSRLEVLKKFEEAGVSTASLFKPDATDIRKEQVRRFVQAVLSVALAWLRDRKGQQSVAHRAKAEGAVSVSPPLKSRVPPPVAAVKGASAPMTRRRRLGVRKSRRRILSLPAAMSSSALQDWSDLTLKVSQEDDGLIGISIGKTDCGRCSYRTLGLALREWAMLRALARLDKGTDRSELKKGKRRRTISGLNKKLMDFFNMPELAIRRYMPLFNLGLIATAQEKELEQLIKEQAWDQGHDHILRGDPVAGRLRKRRLMPDGFASAEGLPEPDESEMDENWSSGQPPPAW